MGYAMSTTPIPAGLKADKLLTIEAARGIVNFKLATKELLDSVIQRLAGKADLAQRGDAFYRPKKI